jgi:integrase
MSTTRSHNWGSVGKHLRTYTKGQITFGNVTEEWISGFQAYLRSKRIQDSTVVLYMGIINICLNQAVLQKVVPYNPSKNVRKVRVKEKSLKYLTKEQVQQLLEKREGIPDWLVNAFLFSCYTGLRLSDVEGLEWGDLKVTGQTSGGIEQLTIVKTQVKTGEEVRVPLSPKALAIVEALRHAGIGLCKGHERVFTLKGRSAIKRYIVLWRKQVAGVYFSYHSSRHTFGTGLQSAGVDINTTSKLMGHKSLGMTLRYAKVVDETRNEAIDKMAAYWG